MTEGMHQEAAATFADTLAAFPAEAIEKLDALFAGPRVGPETPEAEEKPGKK